MSTILIVDDDPDIRDTLEMILLGEAYQVIQAENAKDALRQLSEHTIDVMLLDNKMPPGMCGLELLEIVKKKYPDMEVIMISGVAGIADAVAGTKKGAFYFLEKPLDFHRVCITTKNALECRQKRLENQNLKRILHQKIQIIGNSTAIQSMMQKLDRIAPLEVRVLITGETGTGKELISQYIHHHSMRSQGPFIAINCAAIPDTLIESHLFGHVKGAFTGALEDRKGKFEEAQKGTIFLDEIGDMSLTAQAKILRVLESNCCSRVGSNNNISLDIRVIAATNKDLQKECQEGNFREDLYHRLNEMSIELPALRDRESDVLLLADYFLSYDSQKHGIVRKTFSKKAEEVLLHYSWPGNVRELQKLVTRVLILSDGHEITDKDIEKELHKSTTFSPNNEYEDVFFSHTYEDFKNQAEKLYLLKKLEENSWNMMKTAKNLNIQRSNLYKKMDKYGISKPEEE